VFFKKYVIIQNDILKFPICVYRINENQYSALWMRCTHQGTELQVFGEKLQCPAHGSEFDNTGAVQSGPAELNLRTFKVSPVEKQLRISLKAVS
jgi:Rieske Fe-S protein